MAGKKDRKPKRKSKPTVAYTITGGKPMHIERTYDDVGFYPIQCSVECDE